jgi:putative nucleotidyltransferase with HDIG domain
MRRALFVDDEPRVLRGIENLLFAAWGRWEVVTAESGPRALELLAAEPFDIMVTDMRMPGMNGLQLLEHVRERHPGVVTCVLSGHAEADAVLQAMVTAHRYLAKPTKADALLELLDQVDAVLTAMNVPAVRAQLGRCGDIPPRPHLHADVTRLLRSGASLEAVGEAVERDAVVTARVLKVANSVFFRGVSDVTSVAGAISRVGTQTLEAVLAQVAVTQAFSGAEVAAMERVHERLVAVGSLARKVAHGTAFIEKAHLAGMLHDIGRLLFIATHVPSDSNLDATALATRASTSLLAAERDAFGADHAQVGAHLLTLWGFDLDVIEAVGGHHNLSKAIEAGPGPLRATAVASAIFDERHDAQLRARNDDLFGQVFSEAQCAEWRSHLEAHRGAA